MKPSLSVLVPVYNLQASLEPLIVELLEVLPELTPRFEVLIVDDGSTDTTADVAHDLSRRYPQVNVISQPGRLGTTVALRTGLGRTSGDLVLVCDEGCTANVCDIHKLWHPAGACDVVLAWSSKRAPVGRIPRLPSQKGSLLQIAKPCFQLIRRSVLRDWMQLGGSEEFLPYLVRKGCPIVEVEVRARRPARSVGALTDSLIARLPAGKPTNPKAIDAAHRSDAGDAKRPNYLARLKALVLDE